MRLTTFLTRSAWRLGAAALIAVAAGCGGGHDSRATALHRLRVVLDFEPNAVHAGIYSALVDGDYRRAGLDVELMVPGSTSQPLAAVGAGKAELGLADLIDVAIARSHGSPITAVAAVVQRPLVSLMTRGDGPIRRPRDLEGHSVGLTGVPSDAAVSRAIIAGDGGHPAQVHFLTIGFSAVPALVARRVDAAIGFWPADGVELARRAPARIFRIERYGGPSFPELVVFASRHSLAAHRPEIVTFLRVTASAYARVERDPASGVHALASRVHALDRPEARASLARYLPIFRQPGQPWGHLELPAVARFVAWGRSIGLLPATVRAAGLATPLR